MWEDRKFDPYLVHVMSRWLAGLLRTISNEPQFVGSSRIAEYLETGPTIYITNDEACIAALLDLKAKVDAMDPLTAASMIDLPPRRPS